MEWTIRELAQATGLTSRTLRHYEKIGLLHPSRVAPSGYRFYGDAEVSRLYRILSLRALGMPLADIANVLDDDGSLEDAMRSHLTLLEQQRALIDQQIGLVQQSLRALQHGADMSIAELFAGFDQSQLEAEVRERWGDAAWERSAQRREEMTASERSAEDARGVAVNEALREAATAGTDPRSDAFQALIADHYAWITDQWGGVAPDRAAYAALGELYASDARFAATYGGPENAARIRDAMRVFCETTLKP